MKAVEHEVLLAKLDQQTKELELKLNQVFQRDEIQDQIFAKLAIVRDCLRRVNKLQKNETPINSGKRLEVFTYEIKQMSLRCNELKALVEQYAPILNNQVDMSVVN